MLKITVVIPVGLVFGSCSGSLMRLQSGVSWGPQSSESVTGAEGPSANTADSHGRQVGPSPWGPLQCCLSIFTKRQLASPRASNPRDQDGNHSGFMATLGSRTPSPLPYSVGHPGWPLIRCGEGPRTGHFGGFYNSIYTAGCGMD